MKTIKTGDVIRLYGYQGTFGVRLVTGDGKDFEAFTTVDCREIAFGANIKSVVEINGVPHPLESCPIAMPAADYPHTPMFDYDDGPQINGLQIARSWVNVAKAHAKLPAK